MVEDLLLANLAPEYLPVAAVTRNGQRGFVSTCCDLKPPIREHILHVFTDIHSVPMRCSEVGYT
jgi:hypothetical protein